MIEQAEERGRTVEITPQPTQGLVLAIELPVIEQAEERGRTVEITPQPTQGHNRHPQAPASAVALIIRGAHAVAMPWVYMLQCRDGSYYVGSTTDLVVRIHQHQTGKGATYTRRRRPMTLAWSHETESVAEAFALEKQIQNWSRAKREALISGDLGALPGLARGRTGWLRSSE